jgi:FKBP-type peptidyl-prolyl cis-trans isomerase FklB
MKTNILAITCLLTIGCLAGCASGSKPAGKPKGATAQTSPGKVPAATNVLSDEKARVSYAIGMMMGHNFQAQGVEVDPDLLIRGVKDMLSGGTTLLTAQEMHDTLAEFQKTIAAKVRQKREEAAAKNKADGEAFLATNKTKPDVVTLPDGLQYKVITEGAGAIPKTTDVVTVNYRGTLIDGTEFDSSAKAGHPAQFAVNGVIHGWTEALTQMKSGSKWQIFVPAELAYGENGPPGIPPNSVLVFEVELLTIEQPKSSQPLTSDIIKVPSLDEMKKGAKIEVIKPEDVEKAQAGSTNQPSR